MRTFRTLATGIATLALLASTTVGVIAQSPTPSADPLAPAWFTGTITWDGSQLNGASVTSEDGKTMNRGESWGSFPVEASDPRLSGTLEVTWNQDLYAAAAGAGPGWATMRIENADGAWSGPSTAIYRPDGTGVGMTRLVGEGAYEGLSALLWNDGGPIEGVIVPGDLPIDG